MALLHLQSSCFSNKPHFLLHKPHPYTPTKSKFTITSQNSSQSPEPTITNDPITEQPTNISAKKPIPSSGQGFGPAQLPKPKSNASPSSLSSGKKKGRRERDSIIRRSPVEKPAFLGKIGGEELSKETSLNESVFLVTWLGLGGLIFVEGVVLSASGFLPEEWDKFFVKFVYPLFTPTVFLFVAASVAYGVFKYFQNENAKSQK